jgi:hypothetical protein
MHYLPQKTATVTRSFSSCDFDHFLFVFHCVFLSRRTWDRTCRPSRTRAAVWFARGVKLQRLHLLLWYMHVSISRIYFGASRVETFSLPILASLRFARKSGRC